MKQYKSLFKERKSLSDLLTYYITEIETEIMDPAEEMISEQNKREYKKAEQNFYSAYIQYEKILKKNGI